MTEEIEGAKKFEKLNTRPKDKSNKRDRVKPLTKVVIRRLPPTMTEEEFLKQIDPLPDNEYYYFVQADWSLGHDATCRAYINFSNPDDIFLFKDRFDGYVFVDNKGAEYPAIVEYAPFQGLPRNKSRRCDPKCNTIETDTHYLNFLEYLKNEESESGKSEVKLGISYHFKNDKKITSTPLLQYLANKKQERRDERKKKFEEKRQRREEERLKKKNQVAKNVPPSIKEEDSKATIAATKSKEKERLVDNKRDSKSKRRAERDLKRKQEREKRNFQDKKQVEEKIEKTEKTESQEKFPIKEDEKRKEIKKYSQSRKSRNEFRKPEINKNSSLENKESGNQSNEKNEKDNKEKLKIPSEISESVKEFIKSVANIKEFIPRNLAIATNADVEKASTDTSDTYKQVNMSEVREKLEIIAVSKKVDTTTELDFEHKSEEVQQTPSQDVSPESGIKDSSACSGTDKNDKWKDNRSERRIRNKDRPSIEIYQPGKLRMKKDEIKEDRSSSELKDYKSNPTSDCESVKKDSCEKEGIRKKVTRYSERRSSRVKEKSIRDETDEVSSKIDYPTKDESEKQEESPEKFEENSENVVDIKPILVKEEITTDVDNIHE